ncbi:hypothetical protein [Kitasatospora aureofaciens]|uniref:hypothetical protein n=1 Tax=Kitasatospora aureofaciens TaxID=1894 RepID=UPI0033F27830
MRVRHNSVALVVVAVAALVGCSTQQEADSPPSPAKVAADQAAPSGPGVATTAPSAASSTVAGEPGVPAGAATTASSPTASSPSPIPAGPPPADQPTPGAPAAAGSGDGGSPVDVASRFTVAFYSYDWQAPATLDPVERVRPLATEAYLAGLRPTQTMFALRMTTAQETSTATVRTAAVDADAPPASDTDAFVTVSWAQHLTDHGTPTDNRQSWSLHLLRVAGAWRVDAVLAKG